MRIMVVDDEELAVKSLTKMLYKEHPNAEIVPFVKPADAFDYIAKNSVDIALLDIEMGEFSGITLAKKCKDFCPLANVIFVTSYSEYLMETLDFHVSGYLMKPVRANDLRMKLRNLQPPLLPPSHSI